MGGVIAQELALSRPDLVRSLQIVCSWPETDPWLAELILQWKSMYFAMGAFDWTRNTWLWSHPIGGSVTRRKWPLFAMMPSHPFPQTPEMFARQCDAVVCRSMCATD